MGIFHGGVRRGIRIGLPIQAAEDIAGNCLLAMVEAGGRWKITTWVMIDEMRRAYGRVGTPGHETRKSLALPGLMDGVEDSESNESPFNSLSNYELLERLRGGLKKGEVVVMELLDRGLSNAEISKVLGVSPSRVTQRVKRIRMNARLEAR